MTEEKKPVEGQEEKKEEKKAPVAPAKPEESERVAKLREYFGKLNQNKQQLTQQLEQVDKEILVTQGMIRERMMVESEAKNAEKTAE